MNRLCGQQRFSLTSYFASGKVLPAADLQRGSLTDVRVRIQTCTRHFGDGDVRTFDRGHRIAITSTRKTYVARMDQGFYAAGLRILRPSTCRSSKPPR